LFQITREIDRSKTDLQWTVWIRVNNASCKYLTAARRENCASGQKEVAVVRDTRGFVQEFQQSANGESTQLWPRNVEVRRRELE
jgi:hypothetical protein